MAAEGAARIAKSKPPPGGDRTAAILIRAQNVPEGGGLGRPIERGLGKPQP